MDHKLHQINAHFQYGKRLHGSGRLAEAQQVYHQVLTVAPSHPDALDMMGAVILQIGRADLALGWLDRAIAIRPASPAFHVHRAHALLGLGRAAEAEQACREALRLKRGDAEALQALGHALTDNGHYQEALTAYQEAARTKPDLPDVLNNLGTALHHANRLEDAARTLVRATVRSPRDPGAFINLSSISRDLGRFDEAETQLTTALRLAPSDPRALYNQALLRLLLGRFDSAWAGWEARFAAGAVPARQLTRPVWRGEPLAGRTLLINAEQGLGDTIQFCRYTFPSDGQVILEVQPRIARLVAGRPGMPRIVSAGEALPDHDLTCPLLSLPAIYRTTIETIPSTCPYLFAEMDRAEQWRERLGSHGFRVGIAWQGNPARREDMGRSIGLAHYLPLMRVPGVRLISLQTHHGMEQMTPTARVEMPEHGFDSGPDGFIDTAAVMMNLDLVITSDTAVAHLAGALGRPVWVALRAVPDWRWMMGREDSPWYPSMRLFRQTKRDDWGSVFAAMSAALAARDG